MPELPGLPVELSHFEGYFVELLNKLERIASVMERFDNVMNPTLGMATEALDREAAARPEGVPFPALFLAQAQ